LAGLIEGRVVEQPLRLDVPKGKWRMVMSYTVKKPEEVSVAKRWTPLIAKKGFTPIATVFLENYGKLGIAPAEAMLIIQLFSFKWTAESPFPSVTRLATLMNCSTRYVRKMCESLEGKGYINRVEREGTSNSYDLSGLLRRLEAIIAEKDTASTVDLEQGSEGEMQMHAVHDVVQELGGG
jgi:DNA-binding transcriptional regulator YhcF (GntR family)